MRKPSLILLAVMTAALGVYGCASPFHRAAKFELRARAEETATQTPARSVAYDSAVKAIDARDYGRALDYLQLARSQRPNDAAVLNAFGVVYDKLGRLDLSGRYYAQAQALDPGSEIIRHNMAYSDELRARTATAQAAPAEPARAPVLLASAPQLQELEHPILRVASAPAPVALIRVAGNGALLIGGGVRVVDASGQGLGQPVNTDLARRGWTVAKAAPRIIAPQARTTVVYPVGGAAVAHALARTLHGPVQTSVCSDNCTRVTLIVGQDSRRWAPGAKS